MREGKTEGVSQAQQSAIKGTAFNLQWRAAQIRLNCLYTNQQFQHRLAKSACRGTCHHFVAAAATIYTYISTSPSSVLLSLIFLLAWDAPREIRFIHHRRGVHAILPSGGLGARSALDRNINYFHDSVQRARFIVCHHFRRAPSPLHHSPPFPHFLVPPPPLITPTLHSTALHCTLHCSRGGTRPSPDLLRRRRLEMPRYTQPNTHSRSPIETVAT